MTEVIPSSNTYDFDPNINTSLDNDEPPKLSMLAFGRKQLRQLRKAQKILLSNHRYLTKGTL